MLDASCRDWCRSCSSRNSLVKPVGVAASGFAVEPGVHRLKDGGITFHLTQYDAVASINPELARRALDTPRVS